jgi:glucose/arabinose dehydrogenase
MFKRSSGIKGDREENSYTAAATRIDANGQMVIGPAGQSFSDQYFSDGLRNPAGAAVSTDPAVTLKDKQFTNDRGTAARELISDIKAGKLTTDQLDFARVASQNPENKR